MKTGTSSSRRYLSDAPALSEYLAKIDDLGFLIGRKGAQRLSPPARILLTALHQVLCGGQLKAKIIKVTPKNSKNGIDKEAVKTLDKLARAAIVEANRLSSDLRYG